MPKGVYDRHRVSEQAPEARPELRPDDSEQRVRLRSGDTAINPFDIPMDIVNAFEKDYGLSLEWKRYEVFGQQNFAYMRTQEQQGWRALPANHPLVDGMFMPKGHAGPIIVEGNILMERPYKLTLEAREEERRKALGQVQLGHQKLRETPEGQAPRMAPQVSRTREAISIPD